MKASENKKPAFEEAWRNAFEGAEKAPPPGIWDKVEVALSEKENGKLKKRLFFFKLLAAASIAFAAVVAGYQYWLTEPSSNGTNLVTQQKQEMSDVQSDAGNNETSDEALNDQNMGFGESQEKMSDLKSDNANNLAQNKSKNYKSTEGSENISSLNKEPEKGILSNNDQAKVARYISNMNTGESPIIIDRIPPASYLISFEPEFTSLNEPDMSFDHIYAMPMVPLGYGKKQRLSAYESTLWAGLDMGAGQFNPNAGSAGSISPSNNISADLESAYDLATLNNASKTSLGLNEESIEPAQSFAFGIASGYQFAKRWMVIGGIQYRKSVANVESLLFYENSSGGQYPLTSWNERDSESASNVLIDDGISLQNNFEFLAIPVGLGYLIKDGKFSVLVKGALANEWLLSADLEDESGQLNTLDLSGENSPYNKYMLSGRLGTAFGYQFIDHYMITLEPAYQHALTPLTNERYGGDESRPSSLMISFGITYIFNR